ncbi:MAG: response regulator [Thermoanaerobaculia bacterium]|nr:response regulator [Thermoanaerobaculia bacterium]
MTQKTIDPVDHPGDRELAEALAAARKGDRVRARELAWASLRANRERDSAWLLLASLADSDDDAALCLRQVLAHDPGNEFARKWLARIDEAVVRRAPEPPPSEAARFQPEPPAAPVSRPRPRVLVVDDSATVRRLVALALERHGCEVIGAASGIEALGVVGHSTPDLVFLDVGLPHLDGNQICRALKRNERTRDVPVVMLTGRQGMIDRLRGRVAGASDYLTKPVDPKALIEVVKLHLPQLGEPR